MSKKILVVDDEATIRLSLVEALSAEGYSVEAAETGEEALARTHGTAFDLLVTDLKLPGVTGLELLQAIRNQGQQVPVIMMTAYGDVDTAVAAMRLGAYDFIAKPFKLAAIKKQVRMALKVTVEATRAAARVVPSGAAIVAADGATTDGRYMQMIKACPGLELSPPSDS